MKKYLSCLIACLVALVALKVDQNGKVATCSLVDAGGSTTLACIEFDSPPAGPTVVNYEARRSGSTSGVYAYVFARAGDEYVQKAITTTYWKGGSLEIDVPDDAVNLEVGLRWLSKPPGSGETAYLRNVSTQ
jgi:hypothetical protein